MLEVFIALVIIIYFGVLQHLETVKVLIILMFSLIGIWGSYGVAWFGLFQAIFMANAGGATTSILAAVFFAIALVFVHRSFYGMRIPTNA